MSIMTVKDLKKKAPKGEFLAYINKEEAAALKRAGGSGHLVNGIPSFVGSDYKPDNTNPGKKNTSGYQGGNRGKGGYQGSTGETNKTKSEGGSGTGNFNPNVTAKGTPILKGDLTSDLQKYNHNAVMGNDQPMGPPIYSPKEQTKIENQNLFYNYKGKNKKYLPGWVQAAGNFNRKPNRKFYYDRVLKNNAANLSLTELEAAYEKYMDNRMAGYTDAMGNTDPNYRLENGKYILSNQGGSDQPVISNFQPPIVEEEVEEDNGYDYRLGTGGDSADVTRGSYNFNKGGRVPAMEGGIMGTRARRAMGGIMSRVDQRQGYFLGKIVKGVKSAIGGVADAAGKVLKSDLGKAALLAAGAYYMPGFGIKATGGFGNMFKGAKLAGNVLNSKGAGFFSNAASGLMGLKDSYMGMGNLGKAITMGIGGIGLSMIPGLNTAKVDQMPGGGKRGERLKNSKGEEGQDAIKNEVQDAYRSGDPERIAAVQKYYNYMLPPPDAVADMSLPSSLPYPNYAEGGRIGKAEGGLLDMGGMEKDYRAEGGFVPIGEYEKKDDVPARLSVNEFVFTADAVRGAGQGDIDKGAEIMENMMENLENGGTISEESQGKNGAQQMFETSQRLGEVV